MPELSYGSHMFQDMVEAEMSYSAIWDDPKTLAYEPALLDALPDHFSDICPETYDELMLLEPFGEGNPEPIFEIETRFKNRRVLKDKHLSLELQDKNGEDMKAMAFYAPAEWLALPEEGQVRVQFTLMKNEWRGDVNIEGNIISLEEIPEI